jgi:hypothetical protein
VGEFYISRELVIDERSYSEEQLIRMGSLFMVLAEPGAGKTELLLQLGKLLGVEPIRASVFRSKTLPAVPQALVIDAMDEVARIDPSGVEGIILKASESRSGKVIFAGRSSEWDAAETEHIKDYFGEKPVVVRLTPFNAAEQRQLFAVHFQDEDFDAFLAECTRFELHTLLGNPQFLLLFGEAYIESGRHFSSKKNIYRDAVRRLAHEANARVRRPNRPSDDDLVETACEVSAKLMLSGTVGVSATETNASPDYPYLRSLIFDKTVDPSFLIDTRILKPTLETSQHEPVHRIVAEYCAARYLVGRIDNPADRLSLARVLSVIAPKGAVRTELRGMLGWMAALSQEQTQRQLIELDPYAVVANGDPSEFTAGSKKALLKRLENLAESDPLFRRSDAWRQFNVGTFFTEEIRGDVAALLEPSVRKSPLCDLILDLLSSSRAAKQFAPELRALMLHTGSQREVRKSALELLLEGTEYDPCHDLPALLIENTRDSLELAATAVRIYKSGNIQTPVVIELLRKFAGLYPTSERGRNRDQRYFVKMMINSLDLDTAAAALDDLTAGLMCSCNAEHEHRCTCRIGVSKIVGMLLDVYLPNIKDVTPEQIWKWTRHLVFPNGQGSGSDSPSSQFLSENAPVRQAVHRLAIEGLDEEGAKEAVHRLFHSYGHAGIHFHQEDRVPLAQYAFEQSNVGAWTGLWTRHNFYDEKSRSNPLRTMMRHQARENPRLLWLWSKFEKASRRARKEEKSAYRYRRNRFERREAQAVESNRAHFIANREQIEAGEIWWWLEKFAHLYLFKPDKLEISGYGESPLRALRNCIPFLSPHIPTVSELAKREKSHIALVLFAHCLLRIREGDRLDNLDVDVIRAAMTEAARYPEMDDDELNRVEEMMHQLVFTSEAEVETFARAFIEPSLASFDDIPTNVDWLQRKKIFHPLLKTLPLEWLRKYQNMPSDAERNLFAMAAKHGDRAELLALIDNRFDEPHSDAEGNSSEHQISARRHRFWTLNAFFFETDRRDQSLAELRADPKSIISIANLAGRFGRHESDYLPHLSAEAIFSILDAYVTAWPKVPLPSSWGTGDPDDEAAYRFLRDVVWRISSDSPSRKLPVLTRLLGDARFDDHWPVLLTLRADAERELVLQDFRPPTAKDIASHLDQNKVASVEDLRALMVEELSGVQVDLKGLDTDPVETFYDGGKHVNENTARNRVVDMVRARLKALGIPVVIEHHLADNKRSDFTATASISGSNPLLVVEAKGQWHPQLFTAAAEQLDARYSIHPDASGQGIYLVFWFGYGETIAGKVDNTITSAEQLRDAILKQMPENLKKSIDVIVLDVSRPPPEPKPSKAKRNGLLPSPLIPQ